jgi:hypothetical protein
MRPPLLGIATITVCSFFYWERPMFAQIARAFGQILYALQTGKRRKARRASSAVFCVEALEDRAVPSTATWTDAGGSHSWSDRNNWNWNGPPTNTGYPDGTTTVVFDGTVSNDSCTVTRTNPNTLNVPCGTLLFQNNFIGTLKLNDVDLVVQNHANLNTDTTHGTANIDFMTNTAMLEIQDQDATMSYFNDINFTDQLGQVLLNGASLRGSLQIDSGRMIRA